MVCEDSRETWKGLAAEAKALITALSQPMKFPVRLTLLSGPAALWTLTWETSQVCKAGTLHTTHIPLATF